MNHSFHPSFRHSFVMLFFLTSLSVTLVWVQPARAASIIVNTDADTTVSGDGLCTLREAIHNANSDSDTTNGDCAAGNGADTITFDAGYTITLDGRELPTVISMITIFGNVAGTTLQAPPMSYNEDYRIFSVSVSGTLVLEGITIQNGRCRIICEPPSFGGGIFNQGSLSIFNSMLTGNAAGFGGGIYNLGRLTLENCTFSENWTYSGGGGIYNASTASVTNVTLSGNSAGNGGGGIHNQNGTLTLSDSVLTGNSAQYYEGGGAIFNKNSTMIVTNTTISGNSAYGHIPGDGGGIHNDDNGVLIVIGSNLSGNLASSGGGISNFRGTAIVTNSTLSKNSVEYSGGGLFTQEGTLSINNSTIFENTALLGGGLMNWQSNLSVMNTTFSENRGTDRGGGIYSFGTSSNATVTNSTLSGNSAGFSGGGIDQQYGTLTLINSTITRNRALGGGGIANNQGTTMLVRSLISGNSATIGGSEMDGIGVIANNFNVFGHSGLSNAQAFSNLTPGPTDFDATSNAGNVALKAILATNLADNGGSTKTHALVFGSPAIDFGPSTDCAVEPVKGIDQRGDARNVNITGVGSDTDNLCDSGAYEFHAHQPTDLFYLPAINR